MNNTNLKNRLNGKVQNIQDEPMKGKIINMKTTPLTTETALTTADSGYIALTTNALDIINENLKNQPLSHRLFDIIKSPTGGGTVFTVAGLSGDEIQKDLTGIILDYTTPRAYWETTNPVEGTPPACYSSDSLMSFEGKACSHCVYNEFGSKEGDSSAKACKESVLLYLLRPDNIMPVIIRIPTSSKFIFQRYMTRLIGRLIPLYGVVTKITLEKATSKAGQAYAQFNFEAVKMLSPEEAANAKAFGNKFIEVLNAFDNAEGNKKAV
jgi:hypothetical protein